jgi:uncharacterized protein YjgD (DUF1641 family)
MTNEELLLERLARIEERLEGVARVEKQLEVFAGPWENLSDLGRDLSLLIDPTVKKLTEELMEVEIGFQLEDFFVFLKRFLLSLRHLAWALEQLENLIDWWSDMEPMLKIAVPHFVDFLEDLEQKGIFRGYKGMLEGYAKIAQHYTAEELAAIGDGFVLMHGVIKKFSDPEAVGFFEKIMEVPAQVKLEDSKPVGPLGLLWRMRSKECQQGLGVLVELTRAMGKMKNGSRLSAEPG